MLTPVGGKILGLASVLHEIQAMSQVVLHVYDCTNSLSVKANNAVVHLNRLLRDGFGLGGIFHGGVEVYEEEWSFGYCENGSGVFSCTPKENFMYTYRESVPLGYTMLSEMQTNQILMELSREWPGYSYDLLSRNCNHFCDELCLKLAVQNPPAWVNRLALAGDAAVEVAGSTMELLRQAKADIISAGKFALRALLGGNPGTSQSWDMLLATSCTAPLLPSRDNKLSSSLRSSSSKNDGLAESGSTLHEQRLYSKQVEDLDSLRDGISVKVDALLVWFPLELLDFRRGDI